MRIGAEAGARCGAGCASGLAASVSSIAFVGVNADAEQPLLQLAIGGQPAGVDDAVDAAIDHDGDVLRDRGRHADILLDHQHRDVAFVAEPHQHLLDLGDDDGRETLGRLVHDQEMRVGQKRARDRQHLLLAAGKLAAAIVLAFGKTRKGFVDALDAPGPAPDAGGKPQMLVDAERAPQPPSLRHVADAEPRDAGRRHRGDVFAADAGSSRRSARNRPMMVLHSVVLPMPLRPTTENTPDSSVRSTPCSACEWP